MNADEIIPLQLRAVEVQIILGALLKRPYEEVANLVASIDGQVGVYKLSKEPPKDAPVPAAPPVPPTE